MTCIQSLLLEPGNDCDELQTVPSQFISDVYAENHQRVTHQTAKTLCLQLYTAFGRSCIAFPAGCEGLRENTGMQLAVPRLTLGGLTEQRACTLLACNSASEMYLLGHLAQSNPHSG